MESSQAQESLDSGHGLLAAVVSEAELVEVDLELTAADALMGANQPLVQVADGSIGEGHERFDALRQLGPEGSC